MTHLVPLSWQGVSLLLYFEYCHAVTVLITVVSFQKPSHAVVLKEGRQIARFHPRDADMMCVCLHCNLKMLVNLSPADIADHCRSHKKNFAGLNCRA